MKSFFLKVFKQVAALCMAYLLFFGLILLFFVSFGFLYETRDKAVKKGSVLVFDLSVNIVDSPSAVSAYQLIGKTLTRAEVPKLYLKALVDAIDRAGKDERISALFIYGSLLPENYGSNFPSLREVRHAIERFHQTGKPVIAYLVDPSLRDYYLTSVADTVVINPYGFVTLKGLATNLVFFGDALKKYGIGIQVLQAGKYKSLVEIFTGNKMSMENREQTGALLEEIWNGILEGIAESRRINVENLRLLTNESGIFTARQAYDYTLVDEVAYFDEVLEQLRAIASYGEDRESFTQVALPDYIRIGRASLNKSNSKSRPKIALVYIEGDIVNGEGNSDQVGADRVARKLRELQSNDDVKAMVLRVNSPGGSAIAAETIEHEVYRIAQKKPVVVSMGGYAASGGYWISAHAESIYAEPSTITGSIGVFGLYPNIQRIANDYGVTFDGVKTAPFADIFTLSRPKSTQEMALLQEIIEFFYEEFLRKVEEGRNLSRDEVEAIAQGRIWSGSDALKAGLVDKLGGLREAIQEAANLADLGEDWTLLQIPEESNISDIFTRLLWGDDRKPPLGQIDPISKKLHYWRRELPWGKAFNDPKGIYARLPFVPKP